MTFFVDVDCYTCKVVFRIPQEMDQVFRQSCQSFYCPYGHSMAYKSPRRIAEEDKLRQERDRLKQQLAEKDDRIRFERDMREHEQRRVIAAKGQITKLKKRAAAGVCPCCTRHFTDLERHMASKHPDFTKQPDAADNVVKLKTA